MNAHRLRWGLVCLVLSMSLCAILAAPSPTGRLEYGKGREVAKLADRAINESSGIAAGRANHGVFWTHNDSGDRPRVFAVSMSGKTLATMTVTGAAARDWEDMASFSLNGRGVLLIGDVGDNAVKRGAYDLYAVHEPRLDLRKSGVVGAVKIAEKISFTYEDGSHNCESIAVDATDRTIYLVSKVGGKECKVYALAWPKRGRTGPQVARAVATLKIPTTTAMDISPDGLRAVVLTYGPAFEYTRGPDETWAQGFSRPGRSIPMPKRVQGESICYGPDGKTLYLTSECQGKDAANPAPLLEVPVVKDIPAAAAPAAAKPKPEPAPVAQPPAKQLTEQQKIDRTCKGWLSMAESYHRSGMSDKARAYFQKIIDAHPETPWAAKARQRLEEIQSAG